MRKQALPVLMHHLVSNDTTHLSVKPATFEWQLKTLAENGWHGVSLEQAENFLIHGEKLPPKSFLLTFDDGFLDNYVYAWPIMRKYGHKGVVFAVTDRISAAQADAEQRSEPRIRPTIQDVWDGRITQDELPLVDTLIHNDEHGHRERRDLFFTWDEARLMEQSGVMAVAAHSPGHRRVFTGPGFSGFHQPGDRLQTFVHTDPPTIFGLPRFSFGPELAYAAYLPSDEMITTIQDMVPQDFMAAKEFFADKTNVGLLEQRIAALGHRLGRMETEDETRQRMQGLMQTCQAALSRELGHPIRSFCWPWGQFCEVAREAGRQAGFAVFYTTSLGMNYGCSPLAVHRFKVKNRADSWLLNRIRIYSRPILGALYFKMRI